MQWMKTKFDMPMSWENDSTLSIGKLAHKVIYALVGHL